MDISQLQFTLKKAKSYGYEHVGFTLDRGYFCKENISFMDENGYDFAIMVKGMKALSVNWFFRCREDLRTTGRTA